jgi:hypothetical protein
MAWHVISRLFERCQMGKLVKIVPGLGHDLVGGEDPHAVEGRLGLILGRQLASDDPVLLERSLALHFFAEKLSNFSLCSTKSERKKEVSSWGESDQARNIGSISGFFDYKSRQALT